MPHTKGFVLIFYNRIQKPNNIDFVHLLFLIERSALFSFKNTNPIKLVSVPHKIVV